MYLILPFKTLRNILNPPINLIALCVVHCGQRCRWFGA